MSDDLDDAGAAAPDDAALLRALRPAPLEDAAARRLARAAIVEARARRRSRARGFVIAGVCSAAAVALLSLLADPPAGHRARRDAHPRADSRAQAREPSRRQPRRVLAAGDGITVANGSQWVIEEDTATSRHIRLSSGAALFEVVPLGDGGRFAVTTPHLSLFVRGTVFSVEVDAHRSLVRVYAGRVHVDAGTRVELVAGESFDSETLGPRAAAAGRFDELGRRAADREPHAPGPADAGQPPRPPVDAAPRAGPREARAPLPTPDTARQWMAQGQLSRVLAASGRAIEVGSDLPTWWVIQGDALQGLGRHRQAASAYEHAVEHAVGPMRAQAGYLAASVRLLKQDDAEHALRDLARSRATERGAILEERALVLEVQALQRLQRRAEAAQAARRYLQRFPAAGRAAEMAQIAADGARQD